MKHSPSKKGVFIIEKRMNPRHNIELPLDYSPMVKRENLSGTVVNVNDGGILVRLPETFQIGDLLKIKIYVPNTSVLKTIQALAKVVWTDLAAKKPSGEYWYGLQLVSFYKGDDTKFKALLTDVERIHNA